MKIAKLRFYTRFSSTVLPFPHHNRLTHPRPLSGIPDTGLSDEEGINARARALAKRRFQFNIRPTTFPGGHTKAVVVFYFAQEIFYFILPPFYFFWSRRVLEARSAGAATHLFPTPRPPSHSILKKQGVLFFFTPSDLVQIFTYEFLFFRYLLCGPKMTIK